MIPDAAVEAAARGMFAEEQCDRRQKLDFEANWRGRLDDRDRDEYRQLSRAALEAAAPHLMASAFDHGRSVQHYTSLGWSSEDAIAIHADRTPDNPYRSQP